MEGEGWRVRGCECGWRVRECEWLRIGWYKMHFGIEHLVVCNGNP